MQKNEETIRHLRSMRDALMQQVGQIEEHIEHLNATINFLEKGMLGMPGATNSVPLVIEFPPSKLRGLTQVQAVVAIAKHNGGVVKAQDARRIMIRGGVMRDTKNSTNITHNVIIRSEKFERIGPGEYRLKEHSPKVEDDGALRTPVQ